MGTMGSPARCSPDPPEEQTPWSDAVLQVEGTDGVGLQFETAMQTLLCIAEPSRANMIVFFSNRAQPKQQFLDIV